ncbi:MAG: hypothetical protein M3O92_00315 [Actinomycetota bacterium]|nr:hypothetical protein [Actinomycetota bacterium]
MTDASELRKQQITKLEKLLIQEVSAVDDPANAAPGWAVLKSRGAADVSVDDLRKAVNETIARAVALAVVDDVAKATAAYNEIFETVLNRLEAVEDRLAGAARKSIEGQDELLVIKAEDNSIGSLLRGMGRGTLGT